MTVPPSKQSIFETLESEVRSYSRSWPVVFDRALGAHLYAEDGRRYMDFFSGAGALNYGHNNPVLKEALLDYLTCDGITHALDMETVAKRTFLKSFRDFVLSPRELPYKVMFTGPTGANAVEAALKLARKVTGRRSVVYFSNAFHGMSLGALAVTGNAFKRTAAGVPLTHTIPVPFDDPDHAPDDVTVLDRILDGATAEGSPPAAVIVETVQGEGGVNVARPEWLRALAELCRRRDMLLIVDDIQMGCGRTGSFFSFEEAGIVPDIVTLSKSLSGFGLPMSVTLFRPELDVWAPGEHNGTFRGNNPAFVTASAALAAHWADGRLEKEVHTRGSEVEAALRDIVAAFPDSARHRGRGLVWGLEFTDRGRAGRVCARAFENGLVLETSGPDSEVVKIMPALTIDQEQLAEGLDLLARAVRESG